MPKVIFKSLIENEIFLAALQQLILEPNNDSYIKFNKTWTDLVESKNPLLVNRVAAACTLEVSTTVDSSKFNRLLDWLLTENILTEEKAQIGGNWFRKNQALMKTLHEIFHEELQQQTTDKFYLSQFVWELYEDVFDSNPFSLKKQVIKYGAPGTGKTHQARLQTERQFDIWQELYDSKGIYSYANQIESVQFHPSFSYEDFMEGLRPALDNGTTFLTLQNGLFKEFCLRAGQWEIDLYNLEKEELGDWESLKIDDLRPYRDQLIGKHWQSIFELSDGRQKVSDAIPPFFFLIDEVNRAELSRVFGELMYCLEYRGVRGLIKTQYANLNNERTAMIKNAQGYFFFIPSNLYLIGTMNTIDRSVESFDFALRRRFHWEEVMPDVKVLEYYLSENYVEWVPLAKNLQNLNTLIAEAPLLGKDYQIGHAYLMNLQYPKTLPLEEVRKRIWSDSIRPLLQEYLRGAVRQEELIRQFQKGFGL